MRSKTILIYLILNSNLQLSSFQLNNLSSCNSGYYLSGSICYACISQCTSCTSPTDCTQCHDNFWLNGNICSPCTKPCENCSSNGNNCSTCMDPSHQSGINCECQSTYFMNASFMCQSCVSPCQDCTSQSQCTSCVQNYYISGNTCIQCTLPCNNCVTAFHCLTCIDVNQSVDPSNQCQCNPGFLMNGVNCENCLNPCTQCLGSTNYCKVCKDIQHYISNGQCICNPGYVNDNNFNCIPCQQPCTTCSVNVTHCDGCIDIHHQINSYFQCICQDTFYSNTLNTCTPCIQPCALCDINGCLTCIDTNQIINYSKNCICKPGYYQVNFNCSQCSIPCQTCEFNQDHCLTCLDINQTQINNLCICNNGYFDINHICQICQHPCTKCEIQNDHCLECLDPNHDVINNKCVCKFGFGSSGINKISCSLCQYPCLDCSSSVDTCISCIDINIFLFENDKCVCKQGYFEIEAVCIQCSSQCSTCSEQSDKCLSCSDPNHLLSQNNCQCKSGYYTDNSMNCLQCQPPCLTCQFNQDFCTSCEDEQQLFEGQCICDDGYYILDFHCEQCNQNCSKCNSYNECTECIDQYYLYNTQCLKCQIPCLQCSDILTCKTCSDNYIMDNQGKCIQCKQNCQNCIDSINCIKCFDEFYYDNQIYIIQYYLHLYIPCSDQCLICKNNSKFCTSCKNTNYILNKKLELQNIRCNENQLLIGYECINQCGNGIINEQYEQCDDGNLMGGDGCSFFCIQEDFYQCKQYINSPSICSYIQAPDFGLNVLSSKQNQTQIIELRFTQKVKLLNDFSFDEIAIISIIPQTRVNINVVNITSLSTEFDQPIYQIIVEFIDPVEDAFLQIELAQSIIKNEQDLDLIRNQMQISLGNPFILSKQTQQKLTQIVILNDAIMYSMISISGLALLTGNAIMVFNLIDLLQSLSYIRYMQYNFPPHLIQFLNTYTKVSLKPILDHIRIDDLLRYLNGGSLPFQNSKSSNSTQSTPLNQFYLLNAKSCYLSIFVSLLTYFICRLITSQKSLSFQIILYQKYKQNERYLHFVIFFQKKIQKFCLKFKNEYSSYGLPKVYFAILHQFFFSALLQFPNYSFNSTFMAFNSMIAIFGLTFILYISLQLLSITQTKIKDRNKWKYFYQDSKPQFWAFNQKSFQIYRIMFYIFMIVEALNYPEIQSILLSMSSFFYLLYLIKFRPLQSRYEEAKLISREFLFILISGSFLIYSFQLSYNQLSYYGWIHIALFTLMLVSNLVIDLIECIDKALQQYRRKQEKLKKKQIINQIIPPQHLIIIDLTKHQKH